MKDGFVKAAAASPVIKVADAEYNAQQVIKCMAAAREKGVKLLVFPELTEERRKDLVKEVKKKGEEGKVAIRNIRRDGNDAFKKLAKTEVSEDEIKGLEEELQKLTDKYVKDIDALIDSKAKEIMTV